LNPAQRNGIKINEILRYGDFFVNIPPTPFMIREALPDLCRRAGRMQYSYCTRQGIHVLFFTGKSGCFQTGRTGEMTFHTVCPFFHPGQTGKRLFQESEVFSKAGCLGQN
jgi:hypothetical protein